MTKNKNTQLLIASQKKEIELRSQLANAEQINRALLNSLYLHALIAQREAFQNLSRKHQWHLNVNYAKTFPAWLTSRGEPSFVAVNASTGMATIEFTRPSGANYSGPGGGTETVVSAAVEAFPLENLKVSLWGFAADCRRKGKALTLQPYRKEYAKAKKELIACEEALALATSRLAEAETSFKKKQGKLEGNSKKVRND